jgi:hypothetical protein
MAEQDITVVVVIDGCHDFGLSMPKSKPLSFVMDAALRQAASDAELRVNRLEFFLVKAKSSGAARTTDPRSNSLEFESSSLVGSVFARGADNLEVFVVIRERHTGVVAGASGGAFARYLAHSRARRDCRVTGYSRIGMSLPRGFSRP